MNDPIAEARHDDLMSRYIRERFGLPAHWQYVSAKSGGPTGTESCPPGMVSVCGAVWYAMKSGKRKGQPNWDNPATTESTHWYRYDDYEAWVAEWEKREDTCSRCFGAGQEVARVSTLEGKTYKPCRCGRKAVTT